MAGPQLLRLWTNSIAVSLQARIRCGLARSSPGAVSAGISVNVRVIPGVPVWVNPADACDAR